MKSLVSLAVLIAPVAAYNLLLKNNNNKPTSSMLSRRSILTGILGGAAVLSGVGSTLPVALAAAKDEVKEESVYFGVGCFWHIQHEFVAAERELLGRDDHQLTAAAGYAGGKATGSQGRVCYHNLQGIADYGKLGHGEVVGLQLPTDRIVDFSKIYFSLFNPRTKGK